MAQALSKTKVSILLGKFETEKLLMMEVDQLFEHIEALEAALDEADDFDALGTEGWRHYLGIN